MPGNRLTSAGSCSLTISSGQTEQAITRRRNLSGPTMYHLVPAAFRIVHGCVTLFDCVPVCKGTCRLRS